VQLAQVRRRVFFRQAFFRGLQVWVAGAAPPDIALRIGGFRLNLRESMASRLENFI
jgi:hypothetical protein